MQACTLNPTSRVSCDRVCVCVCQELQSEGAFRDVQVVIAGLSNIYTHYITTFEEYQVRIPAPQSSTRQSFIARPSASRDLLPFRYNDTKVPPPSSGRTHSAHTCRSSEHWPEQLPRQVWQMWCQLETLELAREQNLEDPPLHVLVDLQKHPRRPYRTKT